MQSLPFDVGSFAGATCINAIHHFADLGRAFCEIARVLAAGARFVIFSATAEQTSCYWLNHYFPIAGQRAVEQLPTTQSIEAALGESGLAVTGVEPYEVPADPVDLFYYAGKHRPEIYLDPAVRAGISMFADLADPGEVADGVERLRIDIQTGRIVDVSNSWCQAASVPGDYTFFVAQKSG